MNLADHLARTAHVMGDRPALYHGRRLVASYEGMAGQVAALASAFRNDLNLPRGARVALVMKNVPEYVVALYACWWAGLVAVPANAKLHPRELDFILSDSGARLVLATADLTEGLKDCAWIVRGACPVLDVGGPDWQRFLEVSPQQAPSETVNDDLAWLFYTSGTTGRPKGAMLSHGNMLAMTACYFMDVDSIASDDCLLHAAPMSHGSGMYILPHVAAGAAQVIPESGGFEPSEIVDLLQVHRGVSFFAAPTMVHRLINYPGLAAADTSGLKTIIYGGGPMYMADCRKAMEILGPKLAQIYGQGESPMTITALSSARHADTRHPDYDARLASVGVAQSLAEVRISDAEGMILPAGQSGEIQVRGPQVMAGYWNRPDATADAIQDGWLRTGDMGVLDADGFLTLKDRSKDVIISGGSNIYPREVEEVLLLHPAVAEVSVVGRKNPDWGEDVVAFLTLNQGHSVDTVALDALCLEHIARFKRPKAYRVVDSLPKNAYGKVVKTELRTILEAESI